MTVKKNTLKRTFAYTRIADHLANKIASGKLPPGSFLLSERKLAQMYNVNHATARKATQLLVDQGMARKIQGQGVLVAEVSKVPQTTKFIGFILCRRKKTSPFYFKIISCIEKELKKYGIYLIFSSFDDTSDTEIPQILINSAVDGVIVTGELSPKLLNFLQKRKINHVLIEHSNKYNGKSNIVASYGNDIGYKAASCLLSSYKKIALIKGTNDFRPHDTLREQGFIQAFIESSREFDKKMLIECNSYDSSEIRGKVSWLLKNESPDAIFATNLRFANEAASVCRELGIKIPEEIKFAFYSSTDGGNIAKPIIVQTNNEEIGRAAVNRLLDIINERAIGTIINMIPALINKEE